MLIGAGMPCAITNPLEEDIRRMVMASDALLGRDENCMTWIQDYMARQQQSESRPV